MYYFSRMEKDDEPLTPVGVLFSRPDLYQIMNCAVTAAEAIDVQALKAELANSAFAHLPRFTSLLLPHPTTGHEYWRKTTLVLDQHIKVIDEEMSNNVNDYLADLAVSCPLPLDKPLWEVHVLPAHNCAVFRVHHSLADGMCFMSLLQSLFNGKSHLTGIGKKPNFIATTTKRKSIWELIEMAWFTMIFVIEFILRFLWVKDKTTVVSGGDGVQLWPRKLATASFTLEDMNIVKRSVLPNATINDVMLGVLSSGISAYMNLQSPSRIKEGQRITAMLFVNLRSVAGIPDVSDLMKADSSSGWGNKIGFMLHPIHLHKPNESDPVHQLKVAKASMDKKKLSMIAQFSYSAGCLAKTFFGPNFGIWLLYRMTCNTTLAFSNMVGPSQEVTMVGKRVTSIKMSVSSLPHALTIHMVSYAGKAEMQILVAKDIIHDPDVLAKCFEDALQRMKKASISSSEAYEKLLC
ncbi:hypothetical protein QQ045_012587 [Rhodiola kirilowii]